MKMTMENSGLKELNGWGLTVCSYLVFLDMKGCIWHFVKWQIHPFISKGTIWSFMCINSYNLKATTTFFSYNSSSIYLDSWENYWYRLYICSTSKLTLGKLLMKPTRNNGWWGNLLIGYVICCKLTGNNNMRMLVIKYLVFSDLVSRCW